MLSGRLFWSQGTCALPGTAGCARCVPCSGRKNPGAVSDSLDCEIAVKIRIRMESYDHEVLDGAAVEIVETAKRTGAKVSGPVPLPTRIERYTVNRSPFVNKKSREQFEIRTHKRLIEILEPSARTMEDLRKINMPAGVNLKMKA